VWTFFSSDRLGEKPIFGKKAVPINKIITVKTIAFLKDI